jgi:26S proteasome regulatory subunit N10
LVTLTQDLGKLLSSLHALQISGETDFSAALRVAQVFLLLQLIPKHTNTSFQLVLKHRQNKYQHQRIVAFVGSPINESSDDLVKLGKRLKKNNIAVDLVNFGEEAGNAEKLESFINAVNTADERYLLCK